MTSRAAFDSILFIFSLAAGLGGPDLQLITMAAVAWSLPAEQRADTVARVRASLAGMTFFRGSPLPDADLESVAAKLEASAYETARVQGTTTTGNRPLAETLQVGLGPSRGDPAAGTHAHVHITAPPRTPRTPLIAPLPSRRRPTSTS